MEQQPIPKSTKSYKQRLARNRDEMSVDIGVQGDIVRRSGVKDSEVESQLQQHYAMLKLQRYNEVSTGIKLSDVETQQVKWLWHQRIPFGKITILDGDPGMGKSLLALTIAAHLSAGRLMPDNTYGWSRLGGILYIAPEDSAEDTIKPRVEAAGGDPSRIVLLNTTLSFNAKKEEVYERPFSLPRDMKDMEVEIRRINACLIVIDPLTAVLGHNIDSSRDQGVREVLTPLAQLAERQGCAILIIRHLSKRSSNNILYRGAGSIGITAAARMGLLVTPDPDDEQKRVFATIKNNLSKPAPNLTYQIVENERGIPYIKWLGENHHPTSRLLQPGTNLSYERQEILRVLKEAPDPLDAKQIAELTGIKYSSLRSILNRMQEAQEIVRLYRGKYTSPNHPSTTNHNAEIPTNATATPTIPATNPASPKQ
jgi:archaellum biogenesis ATPase FlaH